MEAQAGLLKKGAPRMSVSGVIVIGSPRMLAIATVVPENLHILVTDPPFPSFHSALLPRLTNARHVSLAGCNLVILCRPRRHWLVALRHAQPAHHVVEVMFRHLNFFFTKLSESSTGFR